MNVVKTFILKFLVLSIALARLGTILPVVRKITYIEKCIILESNWKCKMYIPV